MFGRKCSVIAVVHVLPLPGSVGYGGSIDAVLGAALFDAQTYKEEGVDALLIVNQHDLPYQQGQVEPETTAAMTVIANAIKYDCMLPVGIQLLAAANIDALAVTVACGLDFIRVDGFTDAPSNVHESSVAELIHRRAALKAHQVQIFADIKPEHPANTVSITETAHTIEFLQADGVILTGAAPGKPVSLDEVRSIRAAVSIPVLVGSGITPANVKSYVPYCDALIVGSSLKENGSWKNRVDPDRVKRLMDQIHVHRPARV